MEFIVWFLIGAAIGGTAGFIRRKVAGGPIVLHVAVGTVGALVGGAALMPLVGVAIQKWFGIKGVFIGGFSVFTFLEAVIGAVLVYILVATLAKRQSTKLQAA